MQGIEPVFENSEITGNNKSPSLKIKALEGREGRKRLFTSTEAPTWFRFKVLTYCMRRPLSHPAKWNNKIQILDNEKAHPSDHRKTYLKHIFILYW